MMEKNGRIDHNTPALQEEDAEEGELQTKMAVDRREQHPVNTAIDAVAEQTLKKHA